VYDRADSARHQRAVEVIETLIASRAGRITAQILGEFVSVTTKRRLLTPEQALIEAELLAGTFPVFDVTRFIVLEAARAMRDHQLSYWDAQIWATARLNQVGTIFSEDFADGRRLEGVQFLNPLRPAFDLARWR
jgi:predicted nucleic acid-binding protein